MSKEVDVTTALRITSGEARKKILTSEMGGDKLSQAIGDLVAELLAVHKISGKWYVDVTIGKRKPKPRKR